VAQLTTVAVDANFLICAINSKQDSDDHRRAVYLLERLEKGRGKLIIPMPSFAEYLVRADVAGVEIANGFERKSFVQVAPFDRAAAFECAQMDAAALGRGDKRDGSSESWQRVKVDRQIVAIAKSLGAELIVTSDGGVRACALRVGMNSISIQELPFPDQLRQGALKLKVAGKKPGS